MGFARHRAYSPFSQRKGGTLSIPDTEPSTQAEFTLTAADTTAAYRRHSWSQVLSVRSLVGGLIALVVITGLAFVAIPLQDIDWIIAIVGAACVGAIALPAAMIWLRIPVMARRIHSQQASLHDAITVTWSDAGLASKNRTSNSLTPWANYRRWREDRRVILLYHSDQLFQFIPKRTLSEAQIVALRTLAAQSHVPGAVRDRCDQPAPR